MSVVIRDVVKRYSSVVALDRCSLSIGPGELMVLVGPSGCGKTTLLRIVAGFLNPDSGTVEVLGTDVTTLPVRERKIAFIMENLGLYPHLDVFNNIAYPLRVRHVNDSVVEKRVSTIAETLSIEALLGRRVSQLSGGQRQRVALARSLVRDDTQILLADECFSDLDARLRYQLRTEFKELQRGRGLPCIFVTHDQEEALSLGDRIAIMDAGRIVQAGTADELYDDPNSTFVAGFIGSPPMNLLPGCLENGDLVLGGTALGKLRCSGVAEGQRKVTVGVRPEDLEILPEGVGGIPGEVLWVEHLNPDKVVHLVADGQKMVARTRDGSRYRPGNAVSVCLPLEKCFLFDPESDGRRICEVMKD